eukprot:g18754.t1
MLQVGGQRGCRLFGRNHGVEVDVTSSTADQTGMPTPRCFICARYAARSGHSSLVHAATKSRTVTVDPNTASPLKGVYSITASAVMRLKTRIRVLLASIASAAARCDESAAGVVGVVAMAAWSRFTASTLSKKPVVWEEIVAIANKAAKQAVQLTEKEAIFSLF